MGLTVVLESEDGTPIELIEDQKNLLHQLLPQHDDDSYQITRFIDWYGDTTINRLQIPLFLEEWARVSGRANSAAERSLVDGIRRLAVRTQDEVHTYLKFYGD